MLFGLDKKSWSAGLLNSIPALLSGCTKEKKIRVLAAKPGLDGHDRGVKSDSSGNSVFGHRVLKPGKKIEAHIDLYEEIYYVPQGEGYMIVGDERGPVKSGDAEI